MYSENVAEKYEWTSRKCSESIYLVPSSGHDLERRKWPKFCYYFHEQDWAVSALVVREWVMFYTQLAKIRQSTSLIL